MNLKYTTFIVIALTFLLDGQVIFSQTSYSDPPELKEAKKSYSQKKYDTAIKQFTAYAEKNPNDGAPYLYMGYIYESKKDFAKSIYNFRRAVEGKLTTEQKKTTLLKLALYYNYYQEWDQAYVYSGRYLSMNPNNKEVSKIRERAEANKGRYPSRTPTYTTPPAATSQQAIESNPKKTKQEYENILKSDPKNEDARWELSLIAFSEKNFSLAEKLMIPLVNDHPNKPSYSYKLGVTQIRLDKYRPALLNFQLSKKHLSNDDKKFQYFLYLNEGLANYKLNQFSEATNSLQTAYSHNPSLPPLILLTRSYYNLKNYQKCIQSAEKVLKESQDDLETKMFRALCKYDSQEKDAGPLYAFEKELRAEFSDAKNIPEQYFPALIKLARDYTNSEKYVQAEEYYNVLEKDYGKDREYLFYRGKALYYSNNPSKAIVYLEKVERSTAAIYLTSKAYASLGNIDKTKEKLKIAAASKPVYWELAEEEEDFAELRKDPEFKAFLKNKGKTGQKETTEPAENKLPKENSPPKEEDATLPVEPNPSR
ncbi:MAG: hypothetical protein JJT78_10945 [Leptospira sp.]|nr:hypothetical protein [Leptospira sp.]